MQTQLELFSSRLIHDRGSLHEYLATNLPHPLTLHLTRNRVSMLDYRRQGDGSITLRLHEDFVKAPMPILATLRRFIRTRRKKDWLPLNLYVQTLVPNLSDSNPPVLPSRGKVYDLETIRDRVDTIHFRNRVNCTIGWGSHRRVRGRTRRSIRYGSCDVALRTIRLHPLLDQAKVPIDFVEYVVFHEMLHLVIPPRRHGAIWQQHPPEFQAMERNYPRYLAMRSMADSLLTTLDA